MSTYTKEQVSKMLAALVYDIAAEDDDESELDPYIDVYAKRSADDGVLEIIAVTKSFIRRGVVLSPPARHVGSVRSLDSESEIDNLMFEAAFARVESDGDDEAEFEQARLGVVVGHTGRYVEMSFR